LKTICFTTSGSNARVGWVADKDYLVAGCQNTGISTAILSTDPAVDPSGFSDDTVRENIIVELGQTNFCPLSYPVLRGETIFLYPSGSGELSVFLDEIPSGTLS
jgi:hypothetical protein